MEGTDTRNAVMSVKDWLITLIITAIPIVGLIMLFVWAFSEGNVNRQNWAKAALIIAAIFIVLYILFFVIIFGAIMAGGGASY